MENFKNSNAVVSSLHTIIPTPGKTVTGDCIFVDTTPNKDKKFTIPMGGIWMTDLDDDFQNKDNFITGVKYISELARPQAMKDCFDILDWMTDHFDEKTSMDYCRYIGFFCEVGVWKNTKIRNNDLYHKDFPKYLANCMVNYLNK